MRFLGTVGVTHPPPPPPPPPPSLSFRDDPFGEMRLRAAVGVDPADDEEEEPGARRGGGGGGGGRGGGGGEACGEVVWRPPPPGLPSPPAAAASLRRMVWLGGGSGRGGEGRVLLRLKMGGGGIGPRIRDRLLVYRYAYLLVFFVLQSSTGYVSCFEIITFSNLLVRTDMERALK